MGNPARVVCSLEEYLEKERRKMKETPCYGDEYTLRENISEEKETDAKGIER